MKILKHRFVYFVVSLLCILFVGFIMCTPEFSHLLPYQQIVLICFQLVSIIYIVTTAIYLCKCLLYSKKVLFDNYTLESHKVFTKLDSYYVNRLTKRGKASKTVGDWVISERPLDAILSKPECKTNGVDSVIL